MKIIRPQTPPQKKVEEKNTKELLNEMTEMPQQMGLYEEQVKEEICNPVNNFIKEEIINNVTVEKCYFDTKIGAYRLKLSNITEPIIIPILPEEYEQIQKETVADPIETLMSETQAEIDTNQIKVEFTLTKRQYDLWVKKGAERWVKKALVGQKMNGKKKKCGK